MLAVEDALRIVLEHCRTRPAVETPLTPAVLGRVLGEAVASDLDMPPFDKALMDGYAVRAAEIGDGRAVLPVAAAVMAGQTPPALPPGAAIRIMTGAPIPAGADAVVRVEHTRVLDDGRVKFETSPAKPGQSIMRRATEMAAGEIVVKAGEVLTPPAMGLLASVGYTSARVFPVPTLAVLATGDELVEAPHKPGPSQLRNSNGPMLVAQATAVGANVAYLGIARDDPAHLRSLIELGLQSAALVLAGGVSMGQRDLVPEVLTELGVNAHVHHVAMKPGKPFFFGTRGEQLVFGLPGNPVSAFCCFELFVGPALRKLAGRASAAVWPPWRTAMLRDEFKHSSDRPTYHPAYLWASSDRTYVNPVEWRGSPDLCGLARADALLRLPAGTHTFEPGTRLDVLALRPVLPLESKALHDE